MGNKQGRSKRRESTKDKPIDTDQNKIEDDTNKDQAETGITEEKEPSVTGNEEPDAEDSSEEPEEVISKKPEEIEKDKDKLTIFGLMRQYRNLLPNITRYNIPDLVIYCILSYYADDGEYFRICDETKMKLELDNRRAMTLTMSSSVYGSHLIYVNEEANKGFTYSWTFKINQCYLIAIGLVDGLCVKTSYDFTNRNNSYAYYSDGNVFIKTNNHLYHWKARHTYTTESIVKMVLNLKEKAITFYEDDEEYNRPNEIVLKKFSYGRQLISDDCNSLRLAICLYNHEHESGNRLNSMVTLTHFEKKAATI